MSGTVDDDGLTYSFSKQELFLLAKFIRKKQEELPEGLDDFCRTLEDTVYKSLTLEEVKRFYS